MEVGAKSLPVKNHQFRQMEYIEERETTDLMSAGADGEI